MADLVWLRTFIAIHRTGSVTSAARQLGLSQPAASQHLKALENQIGAPLFVRSGRGVKPTPAGAELAELAAEHVDALAALGDHLRPSARTAPGPIHIGGPPDLLWNRVLPALWDAPRHGVRIVARPGRSDELRRGLSSGELDVWIGEGTAFGDFTAEHLFTYELVIIAPRAYGPRLASAAGDAARRRALGELPVIAFAETMPLLRTALEIGDAARRPEFIIPDYRAMVEFAALGGGSAIVPRGLIAARREDLIVIPAPPAIATRQVWMVTRRGTTLSRRLAIVLGLIRASATSWGK